MPDRHAVLSPSASERWLTCPASIRMTRIVSTPVQSDSPYAREGTIAHSVAELAARYLVLKSITAAQYKRFVKKETRGVDPDDVADMARHAEAYATFLQERLALHPNSKLLLEQQLPTGIEQCWGTSDAVIVSPEHVEVVDYKYGLGIRVAAEENPQLKLYGIGALEQYGDILGVTERVHLSIFQPRLNNYSSWELTAKALRSWRDWAAQVAEEALGENAHFGPSEAACRYCPAAGECRARMEAVTAEDFGTDPDLISPEEIGELLKRLPQIKNWCAAVEDVALRKLYSDGVQIPGWKAVMSGGRRSIPDERTVISILDAAGFDRDKIATLKLKGIGDLTKLLGKDQFDRLIGEYAVKGEGHVSLAPEDDRRPAIDPNTEAQKEFTS